MRYKKITHLASGDLTKNHCIRVDFNGKEVEEPEALYAPIDKRGNTFCAVCHEPVEYNHSTYSCDGCLFVIHGDCTLDAPGQSAYGEFIQIYCKNCHEGDD